MFIKTSTGDINMRYYLEFDYDYTFNDIESAKKSLSFNNIIQYETQNFRVIGFDNIEDAIFVKLKYKSVIIDKKDSRIFLPFLRKYDDYKI
jgi:hypothetical protein